MGSFSHPRYLRLLPLVLLVLLAACSGRERSASRTVASPTPVLQGSGPVVIPFFTTEADPTQLTVLHDLIADYQKLHPNVEIDIILASPASRGRRLLTALASGADLGIFEIEPTLMTEWAEAGYLLPLDEVVAAIGEEDYVPGSLFRYDGHVYAIPYAISVYGLWVRSDLLAQAGLPLPRTYEEVLAAARALTQRETFGIALPGGQSIATVNYFSTFLWQNGGDYFTCRGEVAFDSPEALKAVERWSQLTQYAPPGFTVWGYQEQIDAFLRGRAAMAMYAGRLGVTMAEKAPELENRTALVFPPWGPEKVTLGVWSRFAIAAGTRHQQEAKAFLQWLVSDDRLLRYDMTVPGHMIPPLLSLRSRVLSYDDPYVTRHSDWLQSFHEWVPYTNHPAMNMGSVREGRFKRSDVIPPWASSVFGAAGTIDSMLQEIALGGKEPEQAWRDAVAELERITAEWKAQHPAWQPPSCEE
ncbi:MAG: sugar ABC transporter substrate-binding protein [Caldilineae bacterium]|nr:MAG: sugar ABC transporter substrate-binding protein [Caldilineae bacterium]